MVIFVLRSSLNPVGQIIGLDSVGNEILHRMKLPAGVKCIVSDMHWRYAACDDGKVYELTNGVPRVAYEIPRAVTKVKEIVFVLDYSGSMRVC